MSAVFCYYYDLGCTSALWFVIHTRAPLRHDNLRISFNFSHSWWMCCGGRGSQRQGGGRPQVGHCGSWADGCEGQGTNFQVCCQGYLVFSIFSSSTNIVVCVYFLPFENMLLICGWYVAWLYSETDWEIWESHQKQATEPRYCFDLCPRRLVLPFCPKSCPWSCSRLNSNFCVYSTHKNLAVRKIMEVMLMAYAKTSLSTCLKLHMRQMITEGMRESWKESVHCLQTTYQYFAESFDGGKGAFGMHHLPFSFIRRYRFLNVCMGLAYIVHISSKASAIGAWIDTVSVLDFF